MSAIRNFAQLVAAAQRHGPRRIAVAAAEELHVLEAVRAASDKGLVLPTLVGNLQEIYALAAAQGINIDDFAILPAHDKYEAAALAVRLVHSGEADALMKGNMETADLLHAVLNHDCGLGCGDLLTFIWISEVPHLDRLLFISDPGVLIRPTIEQKVQIVQHAIDTAQRLGVMRPRVAILAARDEVHPDERASSDAAALSKMAERGQINGGYVDGPLDLDSAISPVVAEQHWLPRLVAGHADVLIVPDIEAGNILAKGLTYFAHATSASVVVGATAPIILTSRSDSAASKLASIALGVLLTNETPGHKVAREAEQPAIQPTISGSLQGALIRRCRSNRRG